MKEDTVQEAGDHTVPTAISASAAEINRRYRRALAGVMLGASVIAALAAFAASRVETFPTLFVVAALITGLGLGLGLLRVLVLRRVQARLLSQLAALCAQENVPPTDVRAWAEDRGYVFLSALLARGRDRGA